jgi:hypothetical protein
MGWTAKIDALLFQLRAHGWINTLIGATNFMSELFGQHGKTAHEGAADA